MEAGDTGVVIDIHAHVMTPEAEEIAAPLFTPDKDPFVDFSGPVSDEYNRRHFAELVPMLTDPERRLRDMDRMGVDVQAISVMPPQYFYWAEPEVGAKLTGMVNDRHAIETWLFSPSTYGAMTTDVEEGYSPRDQIPVVF